ncbi:MAG: DUF2971 domain-containing protein [Lutisporaceae bacterium]|jgi:hypothetical protein
MDKKEWRTRISRRSDFTSGLIHLTKSNVIDGKKHSSLDILMKILIEQKLIGSTTSSGYINGRIPAVCFQDTPLHSVAENIYYEQQLKNDNDLENYRYTGFGLRFSKEYIFKKGGRPVIYDITEDAKKYLNKENYWRIVNFDLSNKDNFIDWTHEREWRLPGNLDFELSEVEVLIHDNTTYKKFIERCREYKEKDILLEIKSIITMPSILF